MDRDTFKSIWISAALASGAAVAITLIAMADTLAKWSVCTLVILGIVFFYGAAIGLGWLPVFVLQDTRQVLLLGSIIIAMVGLGIRVWPKSVNKPSIQAPPVLRVTTPRLHEGADDPFIEFQNDQLLAWGAPIIQSLRDALQQCKSDHREAYEMLGQNKINGEAYRESLSIADRKLVRVWDNLRPNLAMFRKALVGRVNGGNQGRNSPLQSDTPIAAGAVQYDVETSLRDLDDLTERLRKQIGVR